MPLSALLHRGQDRPREGKQLTEAVLLGKAVLPKQGQVWRRTCSRSWGFGVNSAVLQLLFVCPGGWAEDTVCSQAFCCSMRTHWKLDFLTDFGWTFPLLTKMIWRLGRENKEVPLGSAVFPYNPEACFKPSNGFSSTRIQSSLQPYMTWPLPTSLTLELHMTINLACLSPF